MKTLFQQPPAPISCTSRSTLPPTSVQRLLDSTDIFIVHRHYFWKLHQVNPRYLSTNTFNMDHDIARLVMWTVISFLVFAFLSDSPTDFIRPVYIVAKILAGIIPTVFVQNYIQRRDNLQLPTTIFVLLFTVPLSCVWFVINLKFIHAMCFLWSLYTSSSAISWHTLTHRDYSEISIGEIIIGILICVVETLGAWAAAMALERAEARLEARARFLYINANRTPRPMLTRAQIEEMRARGNFGKLLTEEGFVQG